jgi:hypothetical protein
MRETFLMLERRLAQPDLAFYKHYREDFTCTDRYVLENYGSPEAEYLWVVRESGTHLVRLGVHERSSEWGYAALNLGGTQRAFHVTATNVAEVGPARARALLGKLRYAVHEGVVSRDGVPFALIALSTDGGDSAIAQRVTVRLQSLCELTREQLTALYEIAIREVSRVFSLFTAIREITLDGRPIDDRIKDARAEIREEAIA